MAVPKSTTTLAQISTVLLHQLNLKSRLVARNFLSQLALFLLARRLSFLLTKAGRFILRNKKDNRRAWMAFLLFFCGIDSCFSVWEYGIIGKLSITIKHINWDLS